ncbi:MAG TPA: ABC transporter substrate-binding protein, partial [Enhygromyxa sp.]|nr:ABC transporter substrate-binding protein [Enhygromyxa sp.]
MNLRRRSISLALFTLFTLTSGLAQAGDAADVLEAKHQAIVELVERDAGDAKLGQLIDSMLDYQYLAESSLGGPDNYAKVCADRCAEFEALLTRLIRTNYLKMVRQADSQPLTIVDDLEGRGGVHKVVTRIEVEKNGRKRSVTVEYVMHQVDGSWQIRDIITDDVSLVRTYRSDFHKLAKSEG